MKRLNEMKSLAVAAQAFCSNLGTDLVIRAGRTHDTRGRTSLNPIVNGLLASVARLAQILREHQW